MIAKLRGIVDSLEAGTAVIDVGGVGYLVHASARTLSQLAPGRPASLLIEMRSREDHVHLYGFAEGAEREWFRLLTSVQGVGSKSALALLGTLGPDDLALAVAAGDRAALTRAPGVGAKLASRILGELKDRLGSLAWSGTVAPLAAAGEADPSRDAVSALVNLGYGASEALSAVAAARKRLGDAGALDALIKHALSELAPHDGAVRR